MSTLSSEQCRAARAWLDWSQDELAKRASVGLSAVRDFEGGRPSPIADNIAAMQRAFETAGVALVFGSGGRAVGITAMDPDGGAG